MRHSLHSHILYLEKSIQDVENRLTQPNLSEEEQEDLQLQLTLAESALEHYRQAYTLELSLASPEPPGQPGGSDSNSDSSKPGESKPEKKDGLVAAGAGSRKKRIGRAGRKPANASAPRAPQHSRPAISLVR